MVRRVSRAYSFSDREIRQALIDWLNKKDIPAPKYVGDTPDTKWIKEEAGLTVQWAEECEMDMGSG